MPLCQQPLIDAFQASLRYVQRRPVLTDTAATEAHLKGLGSTAEFLEVQVVESTKQLQATAPNGAPPESRDKNHITHVNPSL